jgi:hypothetical protein
MGKLTHKHIALREHKRFTKGTKTVCVSACLKFFGISENEYHYTSSDKNRTAYINVLRKFGYSVRSKKSEFKASKFPTMTELKKNMRKSNYGANDFFIVSGFQSKSAHLMVLNGNGETIIDTAPKKKWRVRLVSIVEKP